MKSILLIFILIIVSILFIGMVYPKSASYFNSSNYNERNKTIIISDKSTASKFAQDMLGIADSNLVTTVDYAKLNKYDTIVFLGHGNSQTSCGVDLNKINTSIAVELYSCSGSDQPQLNIVKGNKYKRSISNIELLILSFIQ